MYRSVINYFLALNTLIVTVSCESVYEFEQDDFEQDIVVFCILDPNAPSILHIESTYPIVGFSDFNTDGFNGSVLINLYENNLLIEQINAKKGDNIIQTKPKEGLSYKIEYTYKNRKIVSDEVVIPKKIENVSITNKKSVFSKLEEDNSAIEFTLKIETDDSTNYSYSVEVIGYNNDYRALANTYNASQTNLIGDPCNQSGNGQKFVFNSLCSTEGILTKKLIAETVFYSFDGPINYFTNFEVVVEKMGKSYEAFITDLNTDSFEKAFTPYFNAYSNLDNGLGVMAARNTKKIRFKVSDEQ